MKQGIQYTLTNDRIKSDGCYFLCLLQWAVLEGGRDFTDANISYLYKECLKAEYIQKDCTILFAHKVLNFALFEDKYANTDVVNNPGNRSRYIQYLKKPDYSHFLLHYDWQVWDPLDPARPAAKDYRPVSYRVIT